MLVDVLDRPDEVALATALFEERGWTVRAGETATPGRAGLTVEVRLRGARRGAVRAAVRDVERLADQAELGAWVRDAALVERGSPGSRTTYHMHRLIPAGTAVGRRAARVWIRLGLADEHRVVTVSAGPDSREKAEAELAARTLGDRPYVPEDHGLRVPGYSDEDPSPTRSRQQRRIEAAWLAGGAAGLLLAALCGLYVAWVPGPWKLLPALLSVAGALPLGKVSRETRHRSRSVQLAAGLTATTAVTAFGALAGSDMPQRTWWAMVLVLALGAYTVPGLVLALRGTFVVRHAVWLIPLAVPVAGTFLAWLGRQLRAVYLDEFGIPESSVPSSSLWTYLAVAEPLGATLFFVALCAATGGWLRHFHITGGEHRHSILAALSIVGLSFTAAGIGLGVDKAADAAGTAQTDAARGHAPSAYFGLEGTLVCVRPVSADQPIPVDNGPLPTDHPVLSFSSSGDWIHLWDPARRSATPDRRSFAVRREDVQLIPAENPATRRCPSP